MTDKRFSEYADRNGLPILDVLRNEFAAATKVLEIGSGTGQHAVRIAAERIEGVEECGDLFASLGADGEETLKKTLYFPVAAHNRQAGICRKAAAYTKVGAKSTFVCPEFSRLSDERAAMFVVHEALHHAGLSEKPLDPSGMTSLGINTLVGKKCKF